MPVEPFNEREPQALADAEALLTASQQLRVHQLARLTDVSACGLYTLRGFRPAGAWLQDRQADADRSDVGLASRLRPYPALSRAVTERQVSLRSARKVLGALTLCAPHVDDACQRPAR